MQSLQFSWLWRDHSASLNFALEDTYYANDTNYAACSDALIVSVATSQINHYLRIRTLAPSSSVACKYAAKPRMSNVASVT